MKKGGLIGQIIGIATTLVILGLFLAVLRAYDWDIVALFERIGEFFWDIIDRIAEMFEGNRSFRKVVASALIR